MCKHVKVFLEGLKNKIMWKKKKKNDPFKFLLWNHMNVSNVP
jgi:hypothetical protein